MKKFDLAFKQFLKEESPELHRKAVEMIFAQIGLDEVYDEFLKEPDGVKKFFLLWQQAGEEEEDPEEVAGLKKMGAMSKKLFESKDYQALLDVFFGIVFKHLAEFLKLEDREDFETITDHDLYDNNLIPSEIFLQFFLIETLVKAKDFRWDRGEVVNKQNLACFIVCFEDIYEFLDDH